LNKEDRSANLSKADLYRKEAARAARQMKEEGRKNIGVAFSKIVDIRAELSVLELAIGAALHVEKALANPKERMRMLAEGQAELAKLTFEDRGRRIGEELHIGASPEAENVTTADPVHCELHQNQTTMAHVEFRQVADGGTGNTLADPSREHVIEVPEPDLWNSTKARPDAGSNRTSETHEIAFAMAEEGGACAPVAQCNLTESSEAQPLPQAILARDTLPLDQSRKQSTPDCHQDDAEASPSKGVEQSVGSEIGGRMGQEPSKAGEPPQSSSSPIRAQRNPAPQPSPIPLRGSAPYRPSIGVSNGNTSRPVTNLNSDRPSEKS
jgi:hypothetical protein